MEKLKDMKIQDKLPNIEKISILSVLQDQSSFNIENLIREEKISSDLFNELLDETILVDFVNELLKEIYCPVLDRMPIKILKKIVDKLSFNSFLNLRATSKRLQSFIDGYEKIKTDIIIRLECPRSFLFMLQNQQYMIFDVDMKQSISKLILEAFSSGLRQNFKIILRNFSYNELPQLTYIAPFLNGIEFFMDDYIDDKKFECQYYKLDFTNLESLCIRFSELKYPHSNTIKSENNTKFLECLNINKTYLKALKMWDYCGNDETLARFTNGLDLIYLELGIHETCKFYEIGIKCEDNLKISTKCLKVYYNCENKGFVFGLIRYLDCTNLETFYIDSSIRKDEDFISSIEKSILQNSKNLKNLSISTELSSVYNCSQNSKLEFVEIGFMDFKDIESKFRQIIEGNCLSMSIKSLSIILEHYVIEDKYIAKKLNQKFGTAAINDNLKYFKKALSLALSNLVKKYPLIKLIYIICNDFSKKKHGAGIKYNLIQFNEEFNNKNDILNTNMPNDVYVILLYNYKKNFFSHSWSNSYSKSFERRVLSPIKQES